MVGFSNAEGKRTSDEAATMAEVEGGSEVSAVAMPTDVASSKSPVCLHGMVRI